MGVLRDSRRKFSGHPYIGRIARSSLRCSAFLLQHAVREIVAAFRQHGMSEFDSRCVLQTNHNGSRPTVHRTRRPCPRTHRLNDPDRISRFTCRTQAHHSSPTTGLTSKLIRLNRLTRLNLKHGRVAYIASFTLLSDPSLTSSTPPATGTLKMRDRKKPPTSMESLT